MKRIKLTNYYLKDKESIYTKQKKNYSTYLGNGARFASGQRHKVVQFLNQASDQLTGILNRVNWLYGNVFLEYRLIWPYLPENERLHIAHIVEWSEKQLDMAVERAHWQNSNSYVFSHLRRTLKNIDEICIFVSRYAENRNLTPTVHKIENYREMVNSELCKLDKIGKS